MKEALSMGTESMYALPLLLEQMHQMRLAELLDIPLPTHGHRRGASVGDLGVIWLTSLLSQADHRMNHVQAWASQRVETLRGCGMPSLMVLDLTDGLRADVLRVLPHDEHGQACEQELMGPLLARLRSLDEVCPH